MSAEQFWFVRDYLPESAEREADLAALSTVVAAWPEAVVSAVPVPWDCTDGFYAAYWRRPRAYLSSVVRASISAFALLDPALVDRAVDALRADLDSGRWASRYAHLLGRADLDAGYRLVVRG